jgi:hypothetical protein
MPWIAPAAAPIEVHFDSGPDDVRHRLRASLEHWSAPETKRREQWGFYGEVLQHRIRVYARWEYQPAAPAILEGDLVASAGGGSDFIGTLGKPRWIRVFHVVSRLLALGLALVTVVWLIAVIAGFDAVAGALRLTPAMFILLVAFVAFAVWRERRAQRRREGKRTGGAADALRTWLTTIEQWSPAA